jgi:hypothetical protein
LGILAGDGMHVAMAGIAQSKSLVRLLIPVRVQGFGRLLMKGHRFVPAHHTLASVYLHYVIIKNV